MINLSHYVRADGKYGTDAMPSETTRCPHTMHKNSHDLIYGPDSMIQSEYISQFMSYMAPLSLLNYYTASKSGRKGPL